MAQALFKAIKQISTAINSLCVNYYSELFVEHDFSVQCNVEMVSSVDHYGAETCVVNYKVFNETSGRGVDKSRT